MAVVPTIGPRWRNRERYGTGAEDSILRILSLNCLQLLRLFNIDFTEKRLAVYNSTALVHHHSFSASANPLLGR